MLINNIKGRASTSLHEPAAQPHCIGCNDTGSFHVDNNKWPCTYCMMAVVNYPHYMVPEKKQETASALREALGETDVTESGVLAEPFLHFMEGEQGSEVRSWIENTFEREYPMFREGEETW